MNDTSCKQLIKLQAERVELLAMLADTSARANRFEMAIRDLITTLETALPGRLVQVLMDKLHDALGESNEQ